MSCDVTSHGAPYMIGEVVMQAMAASPDMYGALLVNNPTSPSDIAQGSRMMLYIDSGDALVQQPGQVAQRTYTFQVGAISREPGAQARDKAHADYTTLKRAVRSAIKGLQTEGIRATGGMQENSVVYKLDNLDIGGALVLGTFSVNYRETF